MCWLGKQKSKKPAGGKSEKCLMERGVTPGGRWRGRAWREKEGWTKRWGALGFTPSARKLWNVKLRRGKSTISPIFHQIPGPRQGQEAGRAEVKQLLPGTLE